MKKLILWSLTLVTLLSFVGPVSLAAAATPKDSLCEGVGLISDDKTCNPEGSQRTVSDTLKNVLDLLSVVVGVVAVVMIVIGGLKYITSGGDSNKVSSAKDTVLFSVIGLAVVALAQVIVRFVILRATTPPAPKPTSSVRLVLAE